LKSYDNHILIQQLLSIALCGSLPKKDVKHLIELSAFFRGICSKMLMEEDLARNEAEIPIILCKLEQIFPPSFLKSIVHVVIHLVRECRLGDRYTIGGCIRLRGNTSIIYIRVFFSSIVSMRLYKR